MEKHDKDITVTIQTGRGSGSFTFPQQMKVADVISAAVQRFELAPSDSYSLLRVRTNEVLDAQRPLVSYHVEDGEILTLSAIGSGV